MDIAQQITLMDKKILHRIGPWELMNQNWTKDETSNVVLWTRWFNSVTNLVKAQILCESSLKEQIRAVCKFSDVLKELYVLNNFQSLLAVYLGLVSNVVSKQKYLWNQKALSGRPKAQIDKMKKLCSPEGTFKKLQNRMKEITDGQLIVPYVGIFLQEITFCEEKHPKTTDRNLINCYRLKNLGAILNKVQAYQGEIPNINEIPEIQCWLTYAPRYTDDIYYSCSAYLTAARSKEGETKVVKVPKPRPLMSSEEKGQLRLRVLFTGLDRSGKSTILRQIKFACDHAYRNELERGAEPFKNQIHSAMLQLIKVAKEWDPEEDPYVEEEEEETEIEESNKSTDSIATSRKKTDTSVSGRSNSLAYFTTSDSTSETADNAEGQISDSKKIKNSAKEKRKSGRHKANSVLRPEDEGRKEDIVLGVGRKNFRQLSDTNLVDGEDAAEDVPENEVRGSASGTDSPAPPRPSKPPPEFEIICEGASQKLEEYHQKCLQVKENYIKQAEEYLNSLLLSYQKEIEHITSDPSLTSSQKIVTTKASVNTETLSSIFLLSFENEIECESDSDSEFKKTRKPVSALLPRKPQKSKLKKKTPSLIGRRGSVVQQSNQIDSSLSINLSKESPLAKTKTNPQIDNDFPLSPNKRKSHSFLQNTIIRSNTENKKIGAKRMPTPTPSNTLLSNSSPLDGTNQSDTDINTNTPPNAPTLLDNSVTNVNSDMQNNSNEGLNSDAAGTKLEETDKDSTPESPALLNQTGSPTPTSLPPFSPLSKTISFREKLPVWSAKELKIEDEVVEEDKEIPTVHVEKIPKQIPEEELKLMDIVSDADELTKEVSETFSKLWGTARFKAAAKKFEFKIPPFSSYLFDRSMEAAEPNFVPSDQDFLRTYMPSKGIYTGKDISFQSNTKHNKKQVFSFMDASGNKNEIRKWQEKFEESDVIAFVVPLDECFFPASPLTSTSSSSTRTIQLTPTLSRSLEVWADTTAHQKLSAVPFSLILNKRDVFEEQLRKSFLGPYEDMDSNLFVDKKYCVNYIIQRFRRAFRGNFMVEHVISALDKEDCTTLSVSFMMF